VVEQLHSIVVARVHVVESVVRNAVEPLAQGGVVWMVLEGTDGDKQLRHEEHGLSGDTGDVGIGNGVCVIGWGLAW